jgi:hypothetical protein
LAKIYQSGVNVVKLIFPLSQPQNMPGVFGPPKFLSKYSNIWMSIQVQHLMVPDTMGWLPTLQAIFNALKPF